MVQMKEGIPMKKVAISIAIGVVFTCFAGMTVSAEDEHVVEKGDTLWNISQRYDITVEEIMEINELEKSTIHPKQTLNLYTTYKVEKGDTLTKISEDLDVSVDQLKEWNDLESDLITAGQILNIKSKQTQESVKEGKSENNSKEEKSDNHSAEVDATNNESLEEQTLSMTATAYTAECEGSTGVTYTGIDSNKNKEEKSDNQSDEVDDTNTESLEEQTLSMTATAYTAECEGCTGVTYTGIDLNENPEEKVIAVDPDVIPLGSEVYVEGYGHAIAADIGSAIKGNKIDIFVPTQDEALDWGVKDVDVTIIDE